MVDYTRYYVGLPTSSQPLDTVEGPVRESGRRRFGGRERVLMIPLLHDCGPPNLGLRARREERERGWEGKVWR